MLCPICDSCLAEEFLQRQQVPVHQNLLISNQHSAINARRGDITMCVCKNCGFVFNHRFDPQKLSYGGEYENTQTHSPYFLKYLQDYAKWLINDENVQNKRIVEVGCGKGAFIRMLIEPEEYNNTGHGFDPSYLGPLEELSGRLRFHRKFYDSNSEHIPADIVVCRHVIEHIQYPIQLLSSVRKALLNNIDARIYFETPCVNWILKNKVIWDIFYEHCSLFTASSLCTAFQKAGFAVDNVKHIFEGQYLLISATFKNEDEYVEFNPGNTCKLAHEYSKQEKGIVRQWKSKIEKLATQGNIAVWGAGAKGNTFVNMIDSKRELINCLIDVNPNKQDHFVPGTGHPIVGVKELTKRDIKYAIQMNPNYYEENLSLLASEGSSIKLIFE